MHSELGLQIPDPDATEDLSLIIADEQQSMEPLNYSPTRAQASRSICSTSPVYSRILAEFAARVAELDEERFENFVFDDIDPTLDLISHFETILQEVGF